ncbi:ATP-dependent DNA helicase [Trichonephila clavipes]|nr:ATP-dependent DNA helicase [Trichonephila clavipes]
MSGGAVLLLSGDFRQTLQVIPRSISTIFMVKLLNTSIDHKHASSIATYQSVQIFSNQLLDIGNSKVELRQSTQCIKLPGNFFTVIQTEKELIESVFLDSLYNYLGNDWLCNPVTRVEKNVGFDEINSVIEVLPSNLMPFKSIDIIDDETKLMFLNSLDVLGLPPHNLRLKIGSLVILLGNLNTPT